MRKKIHSAHPHISPAEQRLIWFSRSLGLAITLALSLFAAHEMSIELDGIRYFWLDDDQMISMRYAYNLSEGHGLVWNPGEPVEGYSNFLWTLLMAAVHLLPISLSKTALAMKLINLGFAIWVLFLSEKILRKYQPKSLLAVPALWLSMTLCGDLLFWSVNGFETTLLTAVFLASIWLFLQEPVERKTPWLPFFLMSMLPLIRVDALFPWMGAAIFGLWKSTNRKKASLAIACSLIPVALHFLWRNHYYGEWLPNTYFLKVHGNPDLWKTGLLYLFRFAQAYWLAGFLALLAWRHRGSKALGPLILAIALALVFPIIVGKDSFRYARFLAHAIPLLLILAILGVEFLFEQKPPLGIALAIGLVLSIWLGPHGARKPAYIVSTQGSPMYGTILGTAIKRNTDKDTRIAVLSAGALPYFSLRYGIDLLGKTDPRIAKIQANLDGGAGHNKIKVALSLSSKPDLLAAGIAPSRIKSWISLLEEGKAKEITRTQEYAIALVRDESFQERYVPNPVKLSASIDGKTALFVHPESKLFLKKTRWIFPQIGPHRRLDR